MKRLLATLLASLQFSLPAYATSTASGTASHGNSTIVGGGGSAITEIQFDALSFGTVATSTETVPGSITIDYAQPMFLMAEDTTVNGTAVNGTGWVPEVFFDWTFGDDNGLGSVTRGGIARNLGRGIGVIAATAFKPTTWGETCGGGSNNSLQEISLEGTALHSSAREGDSAVMEVCVRNPAQTWPTPVCYGDDADCTNDAGVPAGATHGGTTATDLATILNSCDSTSRWIVLKGGATFSTGSTSITMGAQKCLIQSYGTGRAKLHFTSTSSSSTALAINDANCAGVIFDNVTVAGGGTGPRLVGATGGTGCYAFVDSASSLTAGEEFSSISVTTSSIQDEAYFIKFDYASDAGGGLAAVYIWGDHTAFVGGEISGMNAHVSAEHAIRMAQWNYVVIDAMKLADQQYCRQNNPPPCTSEGGTAAKSLVTLRQDCGGTGCPNHPSASFFAITRNEVIAHPGGTDPFEICTPGSGGNEPTECYDGDVGQNLYTYESLTGPTGATTENDFFFNFQGGGSAGTTIQRVRIWQNAFDASAIDAGSSRTYNLGAVDADLAVLGDVIVNTQSGKSSTFSVFTGGSSAVDVAKNNVCYDNQAGSTCDVFPGFAESSDNKSIDSGTSPWTVTPGQFTAFDMTDLIPANAGALDDAGVLDPITVDVSGDARPQGTATEPGVQEIN